MRRVSSRESRPVGVLLIFLRWHLRWAGASLGLRLSASSGSRPGRSEGVGFTRILVREACMEFARWFSSPLQELCCMGSSSDRARLHDFTNYSASHLGHIRSHGWEGG